MAWLSAATLALPLTLQWQTFQLAGSDDMLCHDALPLARQTSHWRPAFTCLAVLGCFLPLLVMGPPCMHWRPVASATAMHSY